MMKQMKLYRIVLPLLAVIGTLAFLLNPLRREQVTAETALNTAATGDFFDTGQSLGNEDSRDAALADLDGDGDVDAFVAAFNSANRVWLNDGFAGFNSNGQALGNAGSEGVALGDLDGDADADAFVANSDGPSRVWLNDGTGQFSDSGQSLGTGDARHVALGDLDGDSDLDAFVARNGGNEVWFNDGSGNFSNSGQSLGTLYGHVVVLGDLDGDGDLDAFVGNGISGPQADKVWLNDGNGNFTDSGQSLDGAWTYGADLGDVDGDGDLDAFTASWSPAGNKVWLNGGNANFTDSGQSLGSMAALGVALGDVDEDGDLDAVVANNTPEPGRVWLNDGSGNFSDSGQALGDGTTTGYAPALADLDGDGDLDLLVGQFGPDNVWLNGAPGLPTAVFDVDRATNDQGNDVYYWADPGDALLPVMLSRVTTQTVEVQVGVETAASADTQIIPFAPGEQIKFLNLVNPQPDPSLAVTLTLRVALPGSPPGPVTDSLVLIFVDGQQGNSTCLLCFTEWLGRLAGFQVELSPMHHADLSAQESTPQWAYYSGLFHFYSPEMTDLIAANPKLLWQSLDTFIAWTPAVQSLGEGTGSSYIITDAMVDDLVSWTDDLAAEGSPGLQAVIQQEKAALDPPSFAGLNMEEAWAEIVTRRPISQTFITIVISD
jgi:hypothetical protein